MQIVKLYEPQVLRPQPRAEWQPRSQRATHAGIENRQYWLVTARGSDGVRYWTGCFEDRDDADAFLWHLGRHIVCGDPIPADIRRLPQKPSGHHLPFYCGWYPSRYYGEWLPEWRDLPLFYDLASTDFFTSPTGSNQTYTSKSDWNNSSNNVNTVGGGASGGLIVLNPGHCTGGGGGAWNQIVNFSFASPGTTTATVRCAALAAGQVASTSFSGNGNNGNDTWFDGATLAGASAGSKGGSAGVQGTGSRNGGAGGVGSSGVGTSNNNGGRGGNLTGSSGSGGSGGGGAAGPDGAGNNGGDSAVTTQVSTAGGGGDAGLDGTGGTAPSGAGGNGSYWGAAGLGGGGGGVSSSIAGQNAGDGGLYGAGGGGARSNGAAINSSSGDGNQGLIALVYTPVGGVGHKLLILMGIG